MVRGASGVLSAGLQMATGFRAAPCFWVSVLIRNERVLTQPDPSPNSLSSNNLQSQVQGP